MAEPDDTAALALGLMGPEGEGGEPGPVERPPEMSGAAAAAEDAYDALKMDDREGFASAIQSLIEIKLTESE